MWYNGGHKPSATGLSCRSGKSVTGGFLMRTLDERFWAKVNKTGPLWNGTPCWMWMGARNLGYGMFNLDGRIRRKTPAHRVAYQLLVGPISEGLELDHLCRNTLCVNPNHMEPVTHRENCRRGLAGKYLTARTHCPQGHPYDLFNTGISQNRRYCRACRTKRKREGRINGLARGPKRCHQMDRG